MCWARSRAARGPGAGPFDLSAGGVINGTMTVTYEFTPIPEPGTSLLLAMALAGLSALRRRLLN